MGIFTNAKDASFLTLLRALASAQPFLLVRPVHLAYSALLYWMFGLHPLGYHLVNAAVFVSLILLFHRTLVELRLDREIALAVPLIYSLLPHYSTDRFWFGAFQANLSLALYFVSLYAGLRAVREASSRRWGWGAAGVLSALASILAYEVILPFFVLNLLLVRFQARRGPSPSSALPAGRRFLFWYLAGQAFLIALSIAYKASLTDRLGIWGDFFPYLLGLARGAVGINFVYYGIALPQKVWRIARDYPSPRLLTSTVLLGLFVFLYLRRAFGGPKAVRAGRSTWLKLAAGGLGIFGLGYAVFLTTSAVGFTTTGMNNRTAIAAALGVAMTFVGAAGWVGSVVPSPLRRGVFCSLLALLAMCGFLIVNATARFWIAASLRQQQVIAGIHRQFPALPPGTTLFLDGVCPFLGPAIVFDCAWDATGMLKTEYHDLSLQGDVVRSALAVEEKGLVTRIYGPGTLYPYGEKLLLYNVARERIWPLPNSEAARAYFQEVNPDRTGGCPEGGKGRGVFVW